MWHSKQDNVWHPQKTHCEQCCRQCRMCQQDEIQTFYRFLFGCRFFVYFSRSFPIPTPVHKPVHVSSIGSNSVFSWIQLRTFTIFFLAIFTSVWDTLINGEIFLQCHKKEFALWKTLKELWQEEGNQGNNVRSSKICQGYGLFLSYFSCFWNPTKFSHTHVLTPIQITVLWIGTKN